MTDSKNTLTTDTAGSRPTTLRNPNQQATLSTLPGNPNQQATLSTLPGNPNQQASAAPLNTAGASGSAAQRQTNTSAGATSAATPSANSAPQGNTAAQQPQTTQPVQQPTTNPTEQQNTTYEQALAAWNALAETDAQKQLSVYDQGLSQDAQNSILANKKNYYIKKAMGDMEGAQLENDSANLTRAVNGAYTGGIDGTEYNPLGNGSGNGNNNGLRPADELSASLANKLKDIYEAGIKQNENKVDYGVDQATKELERAWEDAQAEFRTRQNQVNAEENANKDNAALYAEMRGDRGGIGQDQYTDVMNTAAINRQTIQSEQTKLSTDTARQIADLRAQGEFQKADAVLSLTQTYLSQLLELEQFAANYGLSVAQFNESIREFEKEYELSVSQITGTYQGRPTYQAQQDQKTWDYQMAQDGKAAAQSALSWYMDKGIKITEDMARAAGYDASFAQTVNAWIDAQAAAAKNTGSRGGLTLEEIQQINAEAAASGIDPLTYISQVAAGKYNLTKAQVSALQDGYSWKPETPTDPNAIDFNNLTYEDILEFNELVESGAYDTVYAAAKAAGASDAEANASQKQTDQFNGN